MDFAYCLCCCPRLGRFLILILLYGPVPAERVLSVVRVLLTARPPVRAFHPSFKIRVWTRVWNGGEGG